VKKIVNSFIHVIPHLSFAMAIFGAPSESLPLNFNIHPYPSYVSICK